MKTLIEMKKVYCFNRFVLFVMVLSLATTFTSCSNDDDEDIPVYSLKDVEGNYLGKMTTESAPVIPTENAGESEEPVGIEVNAEVKDNEIAINNFPVDDLIKSIIEDPDQAEIIIKAIGDINYKIPYTATFNENKDNILLQLQPEPLEIKFDPSTQLTANEKEPTRFHTGRTSGGDSDRRDSGGDQYSDFYGTAEKSGHRSQSGECPCGEGSGRGDAVWKQGKPGTLREPAAEAIPLLPVQCKRRKNCLSGRGRERAH